MCLSKTNTVFAWGVFNVKAAETESHAHAVATVWLNRIVLASYLLLNKLISMQGQLNAIMFQLLVSGVVSAVLIASLNLQAANAQGELSTSGSN